MAEQPTYHLKEIERYLSGEMTPVEMHAFEKAMLDDPFLSDAVEGMQMTSPEITQQHLAEIENRIIAKEEKSKVVPIRVFGREWMKIAAAVVVVSMVSILTYNAIQYYNTSPGEFAAKNAEENLFTADSISPIALPQATPSLPQFKKNEPLADAGNSPLVNSNDLKTASSGVIKPDTLSIAYNDLSKDKVFSQAPLNQQSIVEDNTNQNLAPVKNNIEIKGRVLDDAGDPVAFATIKSKENNVAAVADSKGDFVLKAPDSILTVQVSSVGYANKNVQLKSVTTTNKIVLEEEKSSLSEIVVTGMASGKRKEVESIDDATEQVNQSQPASPKSGWKAFNKYATAQAKQFKDSTGITTNPIILLEFTIDKNGRPVNIIAKGKSDKLLADRAILILQKGPAWKGQTGKVEIAF